MSRTHKFVGGVVLGHIHLVLVTVVGLWMTPFLLGVLGQQTLGFWLIAQQLLGYLLLMDVGVNALLPRETAFATGRAGGLAQAGDLPAVVGRARRAVFWQTPAVGLVAAALWLGMPAEWHPAAGPLALMLACFVLVFPLRLYQAFLQGVQDLPFLSRVQITSWALTTVVTIALVLKGAGLYALVIGWAAGQLSAAGAARVRIAQRYADAWPAWHVRPGRSEVASYMRQAGWISVAQVAQVFLTGSDLLLVGSVLGAGTVVQYACTSKLATVLSNHPQLIMQAATPALSEMRAANRRDQLLDASVALMLAMLTVSGLVACVILALNGSFVTWWVGREQFGGHVLTMLVALHLIVRHLNVTLIYGLFCFGQERRISLTNLADGAVSIGTGILLIALAGQSGAVIGSIIAVVTVSIPANLRALARETATTPTRMASDIWPWLWRFLVLAGACAAMPMIWAPNTVPRMIAAGTGVTLLYGLAMFQGLSQGPLGAYTRPRMTRLLPVGWWRLRLSSERP
jgi:O-antigen/teichoic acid export membrane protein